MQNLCRTCLRSSQYMVHLLDLSELIYKIEIIASVQISLEEKKLPSQICNDCVNNINKFFNFRKVIINNDLDLKDRLLVLKKETIVEKKLSTELNLQEMEAVENIEPVQEIVMIKCETKNAEETGVEVQFNKSESVSAKEILLKSSKKRKKTTSDNSNQRIRRVKLVTLSRKQKLYKCTKCDFQSGLTEMKRHKTAVHYTIGVCNICGKSMRTDNLARHVKDHEGYKCPQCGKHCKYYAILRAHLNDHKGINLPCDICGKIFHYSGDLNLHRKKHLRLEKTKQVNCEICGKTMDSRSIKRHIRSHTGERPYPCSYCKKGFSTAFALKTHVRKHTKEKPYMCEFCPMAFPQKVSLKTHIRSKHSDKQTDMKK